jgi:hypothetical protein
MFEYDKISKWSIQRRGASILWMAGVEDIETWTPRQAEPDVYILEIGTYPDARVPSQAVRDAALGFLERNILPEVLVVFLHEKGNVPAADSIELRSREGFTTLNLRWRAIKLWEIPAEELFAMGDVGVLPWVPLAKFSESPETIVSRCRARIDRETSPPDRDDLLTASQFLLPLRYDKGEPLLGKLRKLLGGRKAMIQSPLYQEIVEEAAREARQRDILVFLAGRFGPAAEDLEAELRAVEFDRLDELVEFAARCRSLASFRKRLLSS